MFLQKLLPFPPRSRPLRGPATANRASAGERGRPMKVCRPTTTMVSRWVRSEGVYFALKNSHVLIHTQVCWVTTCFFIHSFTLHRSTYKCVECVFCTQNLTCVNRHASVWSHDVFLTLTFTHMCQSTCSVWSRRVSYTHNFTYVSIDTQCVVMTCFLHSQFHTCVNRHMSA